mgnify:CR=1 FL=1
MSKDSYKIGSEFERRFSDKTGSKPTVASGSKWYAKLDATYKSLIFSLKRTTKESFSVNKKTLDELRDCVKQPGAEFDSIGVLCISIDSLDDFVVMTLDDFMLALSCVDSEQSFDGMSDKSRRKINQSKIPQILKDIENDNFKADTRRNLRRR